MPRPRKPPALPSLPNFKLPTPLEFPRDLFLSGSSDEQATHVFVLKLAAAFNDLKGFGWSIEQFTKAEPKQSSTPAYKGQWSGMVMHINRLTIATLYELMVAIPTYRTSPVFERCVASLPIKVLGSWRTICSIKTKDTTRDAKSKEAPVSHPSKLFKFLYLIRNDIGFHQQEIESAYKQWASSASTGAFASLGYSMSETRFFFVDAAFESYFLEKLNHCGLKISDVNALMHDVNDALRFLVEGYLWEVSKKQRPNSSLLAMNRPFPTGHR